LVRRIVFTLGVSSAFQYTSAIPGRFTLGTVVGPTRSDQRRGVAVLLANEALTWGGFYMLVPLLAVHLTQDSGCAS
jgi:hypothetical protein